jgi:hypothetical protein
VIGGPTGGDHGVHVRRGAAFRFPLLGLVMHAWRFSFEPRVGRGSLESVAGHQNVQPQFDVARFRLRRLRRERFSGVADVACQNRCAQSLGRQTLTGGTLNATPLRLASRQHADAGLGKSLFSASRLEGLSPATLTRPRNPHSETGTNTKVRPEAPPKCLGWFGWPELVRDRARSRSLEPGEGRL